MTLQHRREAFPDELAIRALPEQMAEAWNRGCGDAFADPFSEDADFVAFEGTHMTGRRRIAVFHQQLFATVAKGTRLEVDAAFVRFFGLHMAAMHSVARVTFAGDSAPSRSRESMQLFVVAKRDGRWQVEAMMNARRVTLERQAMWDGIEALPDDARLRLAAAVARRPA